MVNNKNIQNIVNFLNKNIQNVYNIVYFLFSQKTSLFSKCIKGILRFHYMMFSSSTPAIFKLVIIQVLTIYIICTFNQKTNYFNPNNYYESSFFYFEYLFYKVDFIDKFVTLYNVIFMFIFMILFIFSFFYIIRGSLYYSLNKYFSKSYTEPNVNIYFIIPLFIIILSFCDYFISNAYFKMILVIAYTFFILKLTSKIKDISDSYKREFDNSIISLVIDSIGCKPIFYIPNCFYPNYYIFSLNLNIRSWKYMPIIILINNKGIYKNKVYFSIDSINALNDNFNKKMVQYSKQEFEMLKILNF